MSTWVHMEHGATLRLPDGKTVSLWLCRPHQALEGGQAGIDDPRSAGIRFNRSYAVERVEDGILYRWEKLRPYLDRETGAAVFDLAPGLASLTMKREKPAHRGHRQAGA